MTLSNHPLTQTLLDKQKDDTLTAEETLELAAIGELDDLFSYSSDIGR